MSEHPESHQSQTMCNCCGDRISRQLDEIKTGELKDQLFCIQCELEHLHDMAHCNAENIEHIHKMLHCIVHLLDCIKHGKAVDLGIVFGSLHPKSMKGGITMPNKKAAGPAIKVGCLSKRGGMKSAQPDVIFTDPLPKSVVLQPLDDNKQPVPLTSADKVKGTLTSDSDKFTVVQDTTNTDTLHYVATIAANTPLGTEANLAATLVGTIQGAAADLDASVKVILNIPPNPVAVDLLISFA